VCAVVPPAAAVPEEEAEAEAEVEPDGFAPTTVAEEPWPPGSLSTAAVVVSETTARQIPTMVQCGCQERRIDMRILYRMAV
jgi:hypothetical protein